MYFCVDKRYYCGIVLYKNLIIRDCFFGGKGNRHYGEGDQNHMTVHWKTMIIQTSGEVLCDFQKLWKSFWLLCMCLLDTSLLPQATKNLLNTTRLFPKSQGPLMPSISFCFFAFLCVLASAWSQDSSSINLESVHPRDQSHILIKMSFASVSVSKFLEVKLLLLAVLCCNFANMRSCRTSFFFGNTELSHLEKPPSSTKW